MGGHIAFQFRAEPLVLKPFSDSAGLAQIGQIDMELRSVRREAGERQLFCFIEQQHPLGKQFFSSAVCKTAHIAPVFLLQIFFRWKIVDFRDRRAQRNLRKGTARRASQDKGAFHIPKRNGRNPEPVCALHRGLERLVGAAQLRMSVAQQSGKRAQLVIIRIQAVGFQNASDCRLIRGVPIQIGHQSPHTVIGFRRFPDDGQTVYLFFGGQKIAV